MRNITVTCYNKLKGEYRMLSKELVIKNMLATLGELQANSSTNMRMYNMLCNKLAVYCEVLDDDLPEDYIQQIEEFIEL